MWKTFRDVAQIACVLLEDSEEEQKIERMKELMMDLWERMDPTPSLDIDDWMVERIIDWLINWMIEDSKGSTEALSRS